MDEYPMTLTAYKNERDPKRKGNLFAKLVLGNLTTRYGIAFVAERDLGPHDLSHWSLLHVAEANQPPKADLNEAPASR